MLVKAARRRLLVMLAMVPGASLAILSYLPAVDPTTIDLATRMATPSWRHPFGTDQLGRDLLARLAVGTRYSLVVALIATTAAVLTAMAVGSMLAHLRGRFGDALTLMLDSALAIPTLMLLLLVRSVLGSGAASVAMALSIAYLPILILIVRDWTRAAMSQSFIEAAIASGGRPTRISRVHILPAISGELSVLTAYTFGDAVIAEATLSFLGLGAGALTPSLGTIFADGVANFGAGNDLAMLALPGLALTVTVAGVQMLARRGLNPGGVR